MNIFFTTSQDAARPVSVNHRAGAGYQASRPEKRPQEEQGRRNRRPESLCWSCEPARLEPEALKSELAWFQLGVNSFETQMLIISQLIPTY